MNLDFTAEIWEVLRFHIDVNERKEAADNLVNLLIEHNHEAEDIKEAFRGDRDISTALKYYVDQHADDDHYDEDADDYDQD